MKKRFMIIISVILAMVMSFSMIGCDGTGEPAPVDFTEEAAYASITKLGDAEGLKGKITFTQGTKAHKDETFTASFDLRGTSGMIAYDADNKAETPDNEYIFDLEKGVAYEKTADGYKCSTQLIPQGIMDYLAKLEVDVTIPEPDDTTDDKTDDTDDTADDTTDDTAGGTDVPKFDPKKQFTANAEARTLTATNDGKVIVNGLITALHTAYTEEATVKSFLEDYLVAIDKDLTVDSLLTKAVNYIKKSSNVPLNMMLTAVDSVLGLTGKADSLTATVNSLLDAAVKESKITAAEKESILKRTVGEMLQGLIDYVTSSGNNPMNTINNIINTFSKGTEAEKDALLDTILNYVLISKVDVTKLPGELDAFKATIINFITNKTFKDLIDMIPDHIAPLATIKTMITAGVTFTALDTEFVIAYDSQMNVKSIAYSNKMSHSYTEKTLLPLLSDNDYHQEFTLEIEQIMTTATPITVENVTADSIPVAVMFVACGATTDDIKVYFESGNAKITDVTPVVCYMTAGSDTPTPIMGINLVTYDAATKYFTIDKEVFKKLPAAGVDSLVIAVNYKADNETKNVVLSGVYIADYTPQALGATIEKYVGLIKGGENVKPQTDVAVA